MTVGATDDILGYGVERAGAAACVRDIADWVDRGDRCRWLACLNPHSYAVALDEPRFRAALRGADWLVPDGAGIVLASLALRRSIRARVTGSDVFWGLNAELDRRGGRSVFFLGACEDTLAAICERMRRDFPNVRVAGIHAPPFRPAFTVDESAAMIAAINRVRPDVLWVGMTAPKQEIWLHEHRHRVDARFAGAVGAVFDFYSGRARRSHPALQRLGLEWLPRLVREPRRLWRRTFVSAPRFLLHVASAAALRRDP